GPDVGSTAETLFQDPVCIADHGGVDSDSGHDGKALLVEAADVKPAARTMEPDSNGSFDVHRQAEVSGEQVRRSRRHDRERDVRTGERVDATLDDSVASPDEDEIRARFQRPLDLPRRLAALRHLVPPRIRHAGALECSTELQET